jgi:tetratricopeptide (TPR) repeat protein
MTVSGLSTPRKTGVAIIGLIIVLVLRREALLVSLCENSGLMMFSQVPAWRLVAVDQMPNQVEATTDFLHQVRFTVTSNVTLSRAYGLLLFVQGQEDEATSIWEDADLSPAQVALLQGRYAESVNHHAVALAWYEQAVVWDENLAAAWDALGRQHQQVGELVEAKKAYEQAFTLDYAASADPLAKLWREEGDLQTAVAVWQAALDAFPDNAERLRWWQGLTNSLRATEQWETGAATVQSALQEFPQDARLYVEKAAIVYGRSGNADAALEAINKAISLDDTVTGAYSTAASILAAEQEYDTAYDWYTEAIRRDPDKASWYVARGHMARAAGDLPLAEDAFQATIARFPNLSSAYFGLALVYQQLGDSEKAVNAVQQAVQVGRNLQASDYLLAADVYEWSGALDRAIAAYQQVLTLDPDNQAATQALQRLQSD